jgi:RNA polymerase sigma-70 factor (ECF subfamily)
MSTRDSPVEDRLGAARTGSLEALGHVLESCQTYLLLIARRELDPELIAKGSASDLVQETFLEVHRDFVGFRGPSEGELLSWLRQLLLNNLRDFTRRYQSNGKRDLDLEVSLDASELGLRFASDSAPPSEEVILREDARVLHQALGGCPRTTAGSCGCAIRTACPSKR